MKRSIGPRAALLAATAAAGLAGIAGVAAARSQDIRGTISHEGGGPVPEGCIALHLEDPATEEAARAHVGAPCIASDGKSRTISFSVPLPSGSAATAGLRIAALLQRSDGRLIARGSARSNADAPLHITLHRAMY